MYTLFYKNKLYVKFTWTQHQQSWSWFLQDASSGFSSAKQKHKDNLTYWTTYETVSYNMFCINFYMFNL